MDMSLQRVSDRMKAELSRQEVIARNLAGVNVPGFKRQFLVSGSFDRAYRDAIQDDGMSGEKMDRGVAMTDFTQGGLKETGRRLDFALEGDGFFEVATADNRKLYTRNGAFHLSSDRTLVTAEGYRVTGTVSFNDTDEIGKLSVTPEGNVRVPNTAGDGFDEKGSITVLNIADKSQLRRLSANYYYNPDPEIVYPDADPSKYTMNNAALETANTAPVRDMTEMIASMRRFEMAQKVIKMRGDVGKMEMQKLSR